jgi:hypothetical protein
LNTDDGPRLELADLVALLLVLDAALGAAPRSLKQRRLVVVALVEFLAHADAAFPRELPHEPVVLALLAHAEDAAPRAAPAQHALDHERLRRAEAEPGLDGLLQKVRRGR